MGVSRRQFIAGCASGLALAACAPFTRPARAAVGPSFDAMGELRVGYTRELLAAMLDAGMRAIAVTLSDPKLEGAAATRDAEAALAEYEAFLRDHADQLIPGRSVADVTRALAERKIAVFYLFQNSSPFADDLGNVDRFHALGLRSCQVTYNGRNLVGAGSRLPQGGGLTPFGHELVARMNAAHMLVDLGHANMETMADTIRASSAPVIISHTGCSAVYPSYRNTTDANLRLLAEHGGVVGIYQIRPFLTAAASAEALPDYFRHIRHAVNVCGVEGVAIGSDRDHRHITMTPEYIAEVKREEGPNFNEADWPLYIDALNGPGRMEVVWDGLRRLGYAEADCERIMIKNVTRLYREVVG